MQIAIIGAGKVGRAVGAVWTAKGHTVTYGVRDPSKMRDSETYRTVAEAAAGAPIVFLAIPFNGVEAALKDCGDLSGKILIDPTNPLTMEDGGLKLAIGFETSAAEFVAAHTSATVVKSLNQVGAPVLGDTSGYAVRPLQFVAGDSAQAKLQVKQLVEDLGFEVLDAGPLKAARLLEPMAMIWIDQVLRFGMDANRAWALLARQA